jgi:hypothetical protein
MEFQIATNNRKIQQEKREDVLTQEETIIPQSTNGTSFIKANTSQVSLSHLRKECVVPVFAKDNEQTITHQEFIESTMETIAQHFPNEFIEQPEIRTSHMIKGRTPDALHIPVKDLESQHKTIYYERMAFVSKIPGITTTINGNKIMLSFGGVRAYNNENLYSRKKMENFQFFIGFTNMVCLNLCVSSDGFKKDLLASSISELQQQIKDIIMIFNLAVQVKGLEKLANDKLNENQFAQLLGKLRLYQHLPKKQKNNLPHLLLNDNHFNTVARNYYRDKSFSNDSGEINLWKVYNLLTGANKSSYIDTFLDRGVNAFEFTQGISKAINGDSQYRWFLS